jgi:uncharacterized protein YegL
MNRNLTDITVLLDRSGSMEDIREDTIGGFNRFLDDQKKQPGQANLTLVQFDTAYEMHLYSVNIHNVAPLTRATFQPRGGTALLDAMGKAIDQTGQRLEKMHESQRPANVMFVIITDGEENSSRVYAGEAGHALIMGKVKHQSEAYNWTFVFLGANQDAIQTGASLGILATNSLSYAPNSFGVGNTYEILSSKTSTLRSTGTFAAFTAQEQSLSMANDDDVKVDLTTPTTTTGIPNGTNVTTTN